MKTCVQNPSSHINILAWYCVPVVPSHEGQRQESFLELTSLLAYESISEHQAQREPASKKQVKAIEKDTDFLPSAPLCALMGAHTKIK